MSKNATEDLPFTLGNKDPTKFETYLFICYLVPLIIFTVVSNSFVIRAVSNFPPLMNPSNQLLLSLAMTDFFNGLIVMPVAGYYSLMGEWHFGTLGCQAWMFISMVLCSSSILHLCAIAIDRYRAIVQPVTYGAKRNNKKAMVMIFLVWTCSLIFTLPPFLGWGTQWPEEFRKDTPCILPQDYYFSIVYSIVSFYLPLFILLVTYVKLHMANRARNRKKIERTVDHMEMKSLSAIGKTPEPPVLRDDCNVVICNVPEDCNPDVIEVFAENRIQVHVDEVNNPRVVKYIVQGSKRRQVLPNTDVNINMINSSLVTYKCQKCDVAILKLKESNICQICSAPNDLLLAAAQARLSILVQKERRSMFIMSIIVCTFIVCWAPGYTIYMTMTIFPSVSIDPKIISIGWWLCYSNSACNPIIYTIFNKDFRNAFSKMLFS